MKPARFVAALFCLVCCVGFAANSTILYKWTDESGNVKFGDRPPAGVKFERIKVRKGKQNDTSAITQKLGESKDAKDPNADVKEQLNKAQEQMSQACKIAKANMATLNNSRLISIPDGEGGKRLLTDKEKEERKKQTEGQIKRYCDQEG